MDVVAFKQQISDHEVGNVSGYLVTCRMVWGVVAI